MGSLQPLFSNRSSRRKLAREDGSSKKEDQEGSTRHEKRSGKREILGERQNGRTNHEKGEKPDHIP